MVVYRPTRNLQTSPGVPTRDVGTVRMQKPETRELKPGADLWVRLLAWGREGGGGFCCKEMTSWAQRSLDLFCWPHIC